MYLLKKFKKGITETVI